MGTLVPSWLNILRRTIGIVDRRSQVYVAHIGKPGAEWRDWFPHFEMAGWNARSNDI